MTRIAEGDIHINLSDEGALAEMRALDREFDRTMRSIDGKEAEVRLTGNVRDLRQSMKEAQKLYDKHQSKVEELTEKEKRLHGAAKKAVLEKLTAERKLMKQYEAQLKQGNARLDHAEKYLESFRRTNKEIAIGIQREKALETQIKKRAREQQAADKRLADHRAAMSKQYEREMATAHKMALQMDRDRDNAIMALNREREAVPRLTREYLKLTKSVEKLVTARRKTRGDERARLDIDLQIAEAEAKMATIKETLERAGSPVNIDVEVSGDRLGRTIRQIHHDRGVLRAGQALGATLAVNASRGWARNFNIGNLVKGAPRAALGGLTTLGRVAQNLSNMTVRIGPFTATIRQAITGLGILGPTILDVVGALGSMVGVVGSAAAGIGALGAGLIGGLIPATVGAIAVIRPIAKEFQSAMKASKAYQDALAKGNMDLAKKKLTEMNNILGNVDASTKRNFMAASKLSGAWERLTAPARTAAFNVIGDALGYASDNVEFFANNTNRNFEVASTSVRRWIQALNSATGRAVLGEMMDNFTASLGPALDGLGNLAAYLGKVGAVASRALPGMARQFEAWTEKLLGTTNNTVEFERKVNGVVDSVRVLGRFLMSTGRLLKEFFGQSVEPGSKMLDDMAAAMDRWRGSLNATGSAGTFFERSVDGAQKLYAAVAPLGEVFIRWATNLQPVVSLLYQFFAPLTSIVSGISRLVLLNGPLMTLVTTLGTLFAVSRISAATRAIAGFTGALFGLSRAQRAVAATGAAATAAGALGPMGGAAIGARAASMRGATSVVPVVGAAAGNMGKAAKASSLLVRGLTGVGAALGVANPLFGAAALAVGAVALGFALTESAAEKTEKAFREAGKAATDTAADYRQTASALPDVNSQHERNKIAVNQAREALKHAKKGTDEYRIAQLNLQDALRARHRSQQEVYAGEARQVNDAREQVKAEEARLAAFDKRTSRARKAAEVDAKSHWNAVRRAQAERVLAQLDEKRAPLIEAVTRANNRQAAVNANLARQAQGMLPVLGQAEQKLGALARRSKSTAVKIALKFDSPKDVGKVAANATRALKSGTPNRIVTKIVADSKNAEDAVRRLQRATITPKKVRILEEGGKKAIGVMEAIIGRKLGTKEARIVENGGPKVLQMLSAIIGKKLPPKAQRLTETGAGRVIAAIAGIIGIKIPNKSVSVTANVGQAAGAIGSILGMLASVRSKTVTLTTTTINKRVAGKAKGRAGSESGTMALVGEGRGPEIYANPDTGAIAKIDRPTFMNLGDNDFVIPTEKTYAGRGRALMSQFAREMGIPGYKRGRGRKKVGGKGKDPENLAEVKRYKSLQDQEDAQNARIDQTERLIREPATFLKKIGQDANGNDLYDIDEGVKKTYTDQLDAVITEQRKLYDPANPNSILMQLSSAFTPAMSALAEYRSARDRNIQALQNNLRIDRGIANDKVLKGPNKGKLTEGAKAAAKRVKEAEKMLDGEQRLKGEAGDLRSEIQEDNKDLGRRRIPEANLDLGDQLYTRSQVDSRINDDKTSANPTQGPGIGQPGGPTKAEGAIASLEAERAMAEIGQGMNGQPPRAMADILKDLVTANQNRIAEGQAMLRDNDPSNDMEAYGIIAQAASAIQGLQQEMGTSAAQIAASATAFSKATTDATRQFGSNFKALGGASLASALSNQAVAGPYSTKGAFGTGLRTIQPAVMPGSSGAIMGGRGETVINLKPTFANVPPDPHAWSKQVAFEIAGSI